MVTTKKYGFFDSDKVFSDAAKWLVRLPEYRQNVQTFRRFFKAWALLSFGTESVCALLSAADAAGEQYLPRMVIDPFRFWCADAWMATRIPSAILPS